MTLDDAEDDNDSNDEGVITGIKVSNKAQIFWQFVMTKKYIQLYTWLFISLMQLF